jgi:hypothetical protein
MESRGMIYEKACGAFCWWRKWFNSCLFSEMFICPLWAYTQDGLETSKLTHCKPVTAQHTHLTILWVEKGRWNEQFGVESYFTLNKNQKAMQATQNPPFLWEQGQRTAKWLWKELEHIWRCPLGLSVFYCHVEDDRVEVWEETLGILEWDHSAY